MKIIICGATGFIGSNLLKHFDNGQNEIFAIYNNRPPIKKSSKNINWFKADLRLPDSILPIIQNTDLFLQFAATTSGSKDITSKPYIHVTDNAVINSYLLRACFENKVGHFIFPSCTVMLQSKENQKEIDWDENKSINKNYFGVGNTKVYIEKMCKFYSNLGLKTTVIRQSNVYGPNDKFDLEKSHVLSATIKKVKMASNGEELEVWGSGKARRDFLYIDDLIDFIEKVVKNQKDKFDIFNCGMGYSISINELVEMIIKISGKNLRINNNLDKPDIPTALSLNCEKAFKKVQWEIKTDLHTGLNKTYLSCN